MTEDAPTTLNPVGLFQDLRGRRASAGVAEGIAGSGTPGDRERLAAGTMAVAGGHAAGSVIGKWFMGDPDAPADETDGARAALLLPWAPRRAALAPRLMRIWH